MFYIQERNNDGDFIVLDKTDNETDVFSRERLVFFKNVLDISLDNYDLVENANRELAESLNIDVNDLDSDLNNESIENDFESTSDLDVFGDNFSESSDTDSKGNDSSVGIIETKSENDDNVIENLIRNCVDTFQTKFKRLEDDQVVNHFTRGIMTTLFYKEVGGKVLIFNLHKTNPEDVMPNFSIGYIDKTTITYRELYKSSNVFYFACRSDYIVLLKRDYKITINCINLSTLKTRIIGKPFKLNKALVRFLPTNLDDYFFIEIISIKLGCVGFFMLLDMTLSGNFYPYKVSDASVQQWLNQNVYYRESTEDDTKLICESHFLNLENIEITDNIKVTITSDVSNDSSGSLLMKFSNNIDSTIAEII